MDDRTLATRHHENMVAAVGLLGAAAPAAVVDRSDGVVLIATGLPVRLFNQVLIEDDGAPGAAVAAAVGRCRDRGDTFVVNLRQGTDDRYLPVMADLGLVPITPEPWMPGMALHPAPDPRTTPEPMVVDIRRVSDAAGLAHHRAVASDGFGMPLAWMETVMPESILEAPGLAVYVGYLEGSPVTSGMGIRTGSTMGVYNIATIPSARRRGLGAAMTVRVIDDGVAAGCDTAILQASDMGLPIYERLGFRTVVRYVGYIDLSPEAVPG